MKLYSLNSKLDFGDYGGESLKEVFKKDPEFIEDCIMDNPSFCFNPNLVDTLEDMHNEFAFSEEAIEKLEIKFESYETEENSFDDMENFSPEDLKNLGISDNLNDDYDDYEEGGSEFYDDSFGY